MSNSKYPNFLLVAIAGFLLLLITHNKHNASDKRRQYSNFLNSHPFNNRELTSKIQEAEGEEEESADRPNLAWEQDYMRTLDPSLGRPAPERLLTILKQLGSFNYNKTGPGSSLTPWEERGPNNIGGRTRALAWDPNDPNGNKVWAGGVTGGLWYTNDINLANIPWNPVNDFWNNIAITAIAFDPVNSQIMYVGTGEGWQAGASRGAGIWKSTNGGSTWTQLSSTTNFYYVNDLVIRNESGVAVVYAAVDGNYYNGVWHGTSSAGLQRSINGGTNWTQVLPTVPSNSVNFGASDIEIGANNRIWVGSKASPFSATDRGGGRVLYSDNGTSWTISNTTTVSNGDGRMKIACAPSNASVVYAMVEDNSTVSTIKVTTDGGSSWTAVTLPVDADSGIPSTDISRGQAWYDLVLTVDPNNSSNVITGAVDLFRSTNGGSSWSQISKWSNNNNLAALTCSIVHADQHIILYKPGSSTTLLSGNDGGIFYTNNIGAAATGNVFSARNNNYNVTQFYACAIHPSAAVNWYLAGAQDNGSLRISGTGLSTGTTVSGGDGAYCFIDQTTPAYQITSYVYNTYYLSTNGGSSFSQTLVADQNTGKFINPSDYDDNQHVLYSARNTTSIARIRNITTSPSSQESVTITGMAEQASHLKVSPYTTTSTTLFIGTEAGNIFKVTNANGTPAVTSITGTGLPVGSISCIEIGANENELLVTFFNYGITSVWYTSNGGGTWVSKEGNLPDMPVRCALFNPNNRNEVLLATEIGVWSTTNLNATTPTWATSNNGLANVRVDMLQMRNSDLQVIAATYGRGVFTSNGFSASIAPNAGFYARNTLPCLGETITLTDTSLYYPTSWNWSITPSTFNFINNTTATSQHPQIQFTASGNYSITLTASNTSGTNQASKTSYINAGGYTLPFSEDWETTTNVNRWTIDNQDLGSTWSLATVSGNSPGTKAMKMTNFNYTAAANSIARDGLISPVIQLNGYSAATLNFKYAYKRYSATNMDSLAVFVSTNCGSSWTRVASYKETQSATPFVFITAANSTSTFTPSVTADWCGASGYGGCKTINLDAFAGQAIKIKFESISGNGNNIYVDDISVTGTQNQTKPVVQFNTTNITPCSGAAVSFRDTTSNTPSSWLWTFTPSTVTYLSGTSASSQHPIVSFNNSGTYSIKLKATNSGGSDSLTKTNYINVNASVTPTVQLNAIDTALCSGNTLLLYANITNGGNSPQFKWQKNITNLNVNNDSLLLNSFTNGDTITCTLTSNATCVLPANVISNRVKVTVLPKPSVTFVTPIKNLCNNDTTITLTGASPVGGVFSGIGVTGGQFKTSVSSTGSFPITYSYTDLSGCQNKATDTIIVNALPTVSLNITGKTLCFKDTLVLNGGLPSGGFYNGTAVSSNVFRSVTSGAGKFAITYTVTSAKGCLNKSIDSITVNTLPTLAYVQNQSSLCLKDTLVLSGGTPSGGVYSGTGVNSGIFRSLVSGTGMFLVQYTLTNGNGCKNSILDTITVNASPTVSLSLGYKQLCFKDTTFSLSGGIPVGGVYSGTGVSGGQFKTSVSGIGLFPINYLVTDAKGCQNQAIDTIKVSSLPSVSLLLSTKTLCSSDTGIVLSGGLPTGGIYAGSGVLNGQFKPSISGSGIFPMTYTFTNAGCSAMAMDTLKVNASPIVSLSLSTKSICAKDTIINLSGGSPSGGTYSGGIINNNQLNITKTSIGIFPILYQVTAGNGCKGKGIDTFTVFSNPAVPVVQKNGNQLTCSENGSTYQWYLNGQVISGATSKSTNALVSGNYKVRVFNSNNCFSESQETAVNTALSELTGVEGFTIYPNPGHGHFELRFELVESGEFEIELSDIQGRIIQHKNYLMNSGSQRIHINSDDLSVGSYLVTIRKGNSALHRMLVVE